MITLYCNDCGCELQEEAMRCVWNAVSVRGLKDNYCKECAPIAQKEITTPAVPFKEGSLQEYYDYFKNKEYQNI